MDFFCNHRVLLTLHHLCCLVAILLFCRGFLLNRTELNNVSECHDISNENSSNCAYFKTHSKLVLVVIDALRFDFVAPSKANNDEFYLNQFKVAQDMFNEKPKQTVAFRFTADPPTTTMQRLKGLTSGSLPTFVDIGSNFASSQIFEDNLISQMSSQQRNLVFLGDDTWQGLFPTQFNKTFFFPSLNVKDLDTVDNGILKDIFSEMKRNEFDVLIAHFLGVDHCGHTFGPDHPRMASKLQQMDQVIRCEYDERKLYEDIIL